MKRLFRRALTLYTTATILHLLLMVSGSASSATWWWVIGALAQTLKPAVYKRRRSFIRTPTTPRPVLSYTCRENWQANHKLLIVHFYNVKSGPEFPGLFSQNPMGYHRLDMPGNTKIIRNTILNAQRSTIGHAINIPIMQLFIGIPEILSQNLWAIIDWVRLGIPN